jgi:hypothetical protein
MKNAAINATIEPIKTGIHSMKVNITIKINAIMDPILAASLVLTATIEIKTKAAVPMKLIKIPAS